MSSKQNSLTTKFMVFQSSSNSFSKIYIKYITGVVKGVDNCMSVLAMVILIGDRQYKKG